MIATAGSRPTAYRRADTLTADYAYYVPRGVLRGLLPDQPDSGMRRAASYAVRIRTRTAPKGCAPHSRVMPAPICLPAVSRIYTFATHLLAGGAPITYVAAQLGHRKPTTTLLFYAHWIPGARTRAISIASQQRASRPSRRSRPPYTTRRAPRRRGTDLAPF